MISRGDGSGVDGVREPRRCPARIPDGPGCDQNAGEASVRITMISEPTREPDRPIPQTQSGGAPVTREAPLRDVLLALAQVDAALLALMDAGHDLAYPRIEHDHAAAIQAARERNAR